jgi:NAD+ synthase
MRLPYGEQRDESEAQRAIEFARPDETLTVDVKPAADAMLSSLLSGGAQFSDDGQQDFRGPLRYRV